jgi:peptidoglycan L-alanyl-D-glutamate endopeptidase CwlK
MASRSLTDLNEILVDAYNKACAEFLLLYPDKSQPFITCTYRSNDEQNALYAQGRTAKGAKVTNAQAGQSPHNYKPSAAFDIAFISLSKKLDWGKNNFRLFADIIVKIQPLVVCGIDFKSLPDAPHFELKDWRKYVK